MLLKNKSWLRLNFMVVGVFDNSVGVPWCIARSLGIPN